jgi:hypothetical protein
MTLMYLVIDNREPGVSIWSERWSKAFLSEKAAKTYLRILLSTQDEFTSVINTQPPDVNKDPWEQGPFIIKKVWLEMGDYP